MKKTILLGIAAVAMISFASCKKDRTCTCTTSTDVPGSTPTTSIKTQSHLTKKEGKRVLDCYSYTEVLTPTTYVKTVDCKIK